jgi:hypothetical protein
VYDRRALLRGAGVIGVASLAGCAGLANGVTERPLTDGGTGGTNGDDPASGSGGGTRPSDREFPADATHEATIAGRDGPPEAIPIRPRVSLADPYATSESPIVLRVDVDNDADDPVVIGEYRPVVFQHVRSTDGTLLWYPHSERSTSGDPDRATAGLELAAEGCWKLPSGIAQTMEYGTVEIPSGGTLTAFVGLYATHEAPISETCFPTGPFRFDATYTDMSGGLAGSEDPPRAAWGFDLTIEAIDSAERE